MNFGEKYNVTIKNVISGDYYETTRIFKFASWKDYSTNDAGNGLWHGDKQIEGTCQFSVAGCKTLKAAKAKIRNYVKLITD